jgi:hypothetical protein
MLQNVTSKEQVATAMTLPLESVSHN